MLSHCLKKEEKFGIKNFKTYKDFGEKVYKIRENVLKNLKELKKKTLQYLDMVRLQKQQPHLIFLASQMN